MEYEFGSSALDDELATYFDVEDGGLSLLPSSEEFIQGTLHADDDDAEAALQKAQQKQHIQQQEARAHLLRDRQQFPGSPVVSVAHATAAAPMPASQSVAPIQAPVVPRPLPLRASSCDLGCFCGDTHAPEMRVQLPMHARTKSGCEKKLSQAQRQAVMVQQRIQQQQALNPKKRQRYDLGSPASAVLPTAHAVPLIPNASGAGQLVPDRTGNGGGGYCYRPHAHPVHGHMQHGHPQEGHVLCRHPPAGMAPHGRLPSGHIQHMHMQSPQYDLGSPTTAVLQGRGPAHRGPREQHYLVHGGTAGDGQDVHELMASRDVSNGYPDGLRPTSAPPERRAAQTAYAPDGTPYAYLPRTARAYSCGMMPPGEPAPPGFPSAQRPGGPSGARPMMPTVQALPCDDGQVLQHGTQQRRPQHPQLVSLRQPHRQQQQNYQWYDAHSQSPQYTQHRQQPQPCYDDGSPIPASYPNSPHFAPTGPPLTSEPLMEPLMPCAVTHLPPSLSGGTPLHPHRSQLPPPLRGRTPSSNGSRGMSSGEGPSLPPFTQAADGRCLPPPALARQGSSAMSGDSGGGADADSGGGVPHVQSCGDPAGQRPDASAAASPQAHPSAETASPDGPEADESGGGGPSTEETVSSLVDRFINNRRRRHCTIDAHLDEVREILSQADPVKFAVWGIELEHADGGPGPEIMQELGAEIELTPEQLAALASHREAIYAERDALMRCHQLLQKTRQQVHLHTQSFSHVMGELRNILSPVQVARFFVWVERNPHAVDTLTRLMEQRPSSHGEGWSSSPSRPAAEEQGRPFKHFDGNVKPHGGPPARVMGPSDAMRPSASASAAAGASTPAGSAATAGADTPGVDRKETKSITTATLDTAHAVPAGCSAARASASQGPRKGTSIAEVPGAQARAAGGGGSTGAAQSAMAPATAAAPVAKGADIVAHDEAPPAPTATVSPSTPAAPARSQALPAPGATVSGEAHTQGGVEPQLETGKASGRSGREAIREANGAGARTVGGAADQASQAQASLVVDAKPLEMGKAAKCPEHATEVAQAAPVVDANASERRNAVEDPETGRA